MPEVDVMGDWQKGLVPDVRPSRPVFTKEWPRVPAGPQRLEQLFRMWLQGFDGTVKDALRDFLLDAETRELLTVGTFCSGTDCAIAVLQAFLEAACVALNIDMMDMPVLQHVFSCEKSHPKQEFLRRFFPNMGHMHKDALLPVDEEVGLVSAGFPCDDASALHPKSSTESHRQCVAEGSMRTGSVFRAISRYLQNNTKVKLFQFENVVTLACKPTQKKVQNGDKNGGKKTVLGPSNLEAVCHVLAQEAGMHSHVWQVDSQQFGSAQQRQRLYGCCFKEADLCMTKASADSLLDKTMSFLSGVRQCDPLEYLLDESSEDLRAERSMQVVSRLPDECFLQGLQGESSSCMGMGERSVSISTLFDSMGAVPCAAPENAKRRKLKQLPSDESPNPTVKWVQRHADEFRKRGEATRMDRSCFSRPLPAVEDAFPTLKTLTRRQLEILHLKNITVPDSSFKVIDLSQTLDYAAVTHGRTPCVTPDGAKFLTQQVRFLTGLESLRFMGIWMDESCLRRHYSSHFLQDLAGNAFETSSTAACMLASFVFMACNRTCRLSQLKSPIVLSGSTSIRSSSSATSAGSAVEDSDDSDLP